MHVKLLAPVGAGNSVSFEGEPFDIHDGTTIVPQRAVDALLSHGFTLAPDQEGAQAAGPSAVLVARIAELEAKLVQHVQDANARIDALAARNGELETDLRAAEDEGDLLETKLEEATKRADGLDGELTLAKGREAALSARNDELEKEVAALKTKAKKPAAA